MRITSDNFLPDFKSGETQIIFQRHANYDKTTGEMLDTENTTLVDYNYFKTLLSSLSDEERENLYILFIASDTKNAANGLERAVVSTDIAKQVVSSIFENYGLSDSHIINNTNFNGNVRIDKNLIEPKMFIDKTGYFEFLKKKYNGVNIDFWTAFEEDLDREYRLQIFGEGPDEIVDRAFNYLTIVKRYSDYFHSVKPNSRLIVWSGTHYDLISPLVKQLIVKLDKDAVVPVDYNGGIAVTVTEDGKFITSIDGMYYDLGDLVSIQLHRHF